MRLVNRRLRKTKNTAVHRDRGRKVQGRSGQGGQGPSLKPGLAPTPCQTAVCSGLPAPYDMHWTMQLRPTNCTISPCRVSPNRPTQQKTGTRMCAPPPPPSSRTTREVALADLLEQEKTLKRWRKKNAKTPVPRSGQLGNASGCLQGGAGGLRQKINSRLTGTRSPDHSLPPRRTVKERPSTDGL